MLVIRLMRAEFDDAAFLTVPLGIARCVLNRAHADGHEPSFGADMKHLFAVDLSDAWARGLLNPVRCTEFRK